MSNVDKIHALMLASSISSGLDSRDTDMDLRGTLTDKINVENFCYNYQRYMVHSTVQLSENQARKYYKKMFLPGPLQSSMLPTSSVQKTGRSILTEQEESATAVVESRRPTAKKTSIAQPPAPVLPPPAESAAEEDAAKGVLELDEDEAKEVPENRQSFNLKDIRQLPAHIREQIKQRIETKTKKSLRKFFDRGPREHCLLFMSGHGDTRARFILNNVVKAELSLRDIVAVWDEFPRRPWKVTDKWGREQEMHNHLLIVIDACRSGSWTRCLEREIRREFNDISIQSSSSDFEKSYDDARGTGGYFLSNFLCINGLKDLKYNYNYKQVDEEGKRRDLQHPTFYSKFRGNLEQLYRLRVGFNCWEELEWRVSQSLSGTFIGKDGDVLTGEFKSIQLHGQGEKRLANGRVERGFFFNNKLEGEGVLEWEAASCSGLFRGGLLIELYVAKLTSGEVLTSLDKKASRKQRNSVLVQDDMVQEICRLNETTQCKAVFEWVKTVFANSDMSEGMCRNGVKHGLNFHYMADGGFSYSLWYKGVQQLRLTMEMTGAFNFQMVLHQTGDSSRATNQEALFYDPQQKDDKSNDIYGCSGQVNALFPYRDADFWKKFVHQADGTVTFKQMRYKGGWKNGPQGTGEFTDGKGNSYRGLWKSGLPEGKGIMICKSQVVYEGFWVNGFRHGLGKITYPNGDFFVGYWRVDSIFGQGKYWTGDGSVKYRGLLCMITQIPNFHPSTKDSTIFHKEKYNHIFGLSGYLERLRRTPGPRFSMAAAVKASLGGAEAVSAPRICEYKGELIGWSYHGFGKLLTDPQSVFEGEFFRGGLTVNNFKVTYPDKSVYQGQCLMRRRSPEEPVTELVHKDIWVYSQRHGKGTMKYADGKQYEGFFFLDDLSEKGVMRYANGDVYEGQFSMNKMDGKGKMTRANGEIYEGQFNYGNVYGYGKMKLPNGDVYTGEFHNDSYYTFRDDITLESGVYSGKVEHQRKKEGSGPPQPNDLCDFWRFRRIVGKGTLQYPNGDVWKGECLDDGPHGSGVFTTVEGAEVRGNLHGRIFATNEETMKFPDGSSFTGGMIYNVLDEVPEEGPFILARRFKFSHLMGTGTWTRPNGEVLHLNITNNRGLGAATVTFPSGETYSGAIFGDTFRLENQTVTLANGSVYTGHVIYRRMREGEDERPNDIAPHWKFLTAQGKGKVVSPNGNIYEGQFRGSMRHGQGQITLAHDESVLNVEMFKDHVVLGGQVVSYPDGSEYTGSCIAPLNDKQVFGRNPDSGASDWFGERKKHGKGKWILKCGYVIEGMFYQDHFLHKDWEQSFSDGSRWVGSCQVGLKPEPELSTAIAAFRELQKAAASDPTLKPPKYPDIFVYLMRHGPGTFYARDQWEYSCRFSDDLPHGDATVSGAPGTKRGTLTIMYENGRKEGDGYFSGPGGMEVRGVWSMDRFIHGKVKFKFSDGSIFDRKDYFEYSQCTLRKPEEEPITLEPGHYLRTLADQLVSQLPDWPETLELPAAPQPPPVEDEVVGSDSGRARLVLSATQKKLIEQQAIQEHLAKKRTQLGLCAAGSLSIPPQNYEPKTQPQPLQMAVIQEVPTPREGPRVVSLPVQMEPPTAEAKGTPGSTEEYVGETKQGKPHGKGILRMENNCVYEGEFAEGLLSGNGTLSCPSGASYTGRFVNNRLHGRGTLIKKEGDSIQGYFIPIWNDPFRYKVTPITGWPFEITFPEVNRSNSSAHFKKSLHLAK